MSLASLDLGGGGRSMGKRGVQARPPSERFWPYVTVEGDCWRWTGSLNESGYGVFNSYRKTVGSHRFAYEELVGEIPAGLTLDHLCRNTWCVNPYHLDPVPRCVNTSRMPLKTVCRNGHSLTPETLYMYRRPNGHLRRDCKQCAKRHWKPGKKEKK